MKRIIYQVVVAETSRDNELMNYKRVFNSRSEAFAKKYAEKYRNDHPDFAFIVLEERHENETEWGWELDHEAGGEKVLEHY